MKGLKTKPVAEITKNDLEKDFTLVKTSFSGKESEENWTDRVASLTRVEEMLNANNINDFKETVAEKLNENMTCIMQSIFSMRSTIAFLGFAVISAISTTIGEVLARPAIEIILNNLIDRSKVPSWLPKLNETTTKFLSHTKFYPNVFGLLKKKVIGGSCKQLELCCIAIKTILVTHGSKGHSQIAIGGNLVVSSALEYVLERGLEKGNSETKTVSKEIFSIYSKNWPDKAKTFRKRLSPETLKRLPNIPLSNDSATKQSTVAVPKKTAYLSKQRGASLQKPTTATSLKQRVSKPRHIITAPEQTAILLKPTSSTLLKPRVSKSRYTITKPKPITTSLKQTAPTSEQIISTPKPTTASLKETAPNSEQIMNTPKPTTSTSPNQTVSKSGHITTTQKLSTAISLKRMGSKSRQIITSPKPQSTSSEQAVPKSRYITTAPKPTTASLKQKIPNSKHIPTPTTPKSIPSASLRQTSSKPRQITIAQKPTTTLSKQTISKSKQIITTPRTTRSHELKKLSVLQQKRKRDPSPEEEPVSKFIKLV